MLVPSHLRRQQELGSFFSKMVNPFGFGRTLEVFMVCTFLSSQRAITLGMPEPREGEFAEVHSLSAPREDGSRLFHLRASGEDRLLHLEASNVFSPNLQPFAIESLPETSDLYYANPENQINQVKDNDDFYTVKDQNGFLHVSEDELGYNVEGMLNDTHQIDTRLRKTSAGKYERHHIVYKQNISPENDLKVKCEHLHQEVRRHEIKNVIQVMVPSFVTVQVFVLLDYDNAKALQFHHGKIRTYVGNFWSKVNTTYARTNNPRIKVKVTAIGYFRSQKSQTFLQNYKMGNNRVSESFFAALRNYFQRKNKRYERRYRYDIAMLQLAPVVGTRVRGKWKPSQQGQAYLRGVCSKDPRKKVAYARDIAPTYSGVTFAAHELAHALGAEHDECTICHDHKRYIMDINAVNSTKFTTCSMKAMKSFVSSPQGKCTWN